jgi:hypothetical protein
MSFVDPVNKTGGVVVYNCDGVMYPNVGNKLENIHLEEASAKLFMARTGLASINDELSSKINHLSIDAAAITKLIQRALAAYRYHSSPGVGLDSLVLLIEFVDTPIMFIDGQGNYPIVEKLSRGFFTLSQAFESTGVLKVNPELNVLSVIKNGYLHHLYAVDKSDLRLIVQGWSDLFNAWFGEDDSVVAQLKWSLIFATFTEVTNKANFRSAPAIYLLDVFAHTLFNWWICKTGSGKQSILRRLQSQRTLHIR